MNTLELAARNLHRNARRSLLTLAALAVGAAALLLFSGYVTDTVQGLQTATVRQTGHFQIVTRGYLEFGRGNPGRYAIRDYAGTIQALRADPVLAPMLAVVTPVLDVEGVASNYETQTATSFSGEGVVPADHARQLGWDGFGIGIPATASPLRADAPDKGVIGYGLAQILGLCGTLGVEGCRSAPDASPMPITTASSTAVVPGTGLPGDIDALARSVASPVTAQPSATVDLMASSASGNPNAVRMTVGSVKRQMVREVDAMFVAMPLSLAQRLMLGPDVRGASSILVQLHDTDQMAAAQARIDAIIAARHQPLELVSFHRISSVYDQIVQNYGMIFQFIAILIVIITLFSIANAINMAVTERTAEIGTLRALGFGRDTIRRIFVTEGALLGLVGTLIGAALALLLAEGVINVGGFSWTPPGRSTPIPIRVDMFSTPWAIAMVVLGLAAVAALSAVLPAARAAKLEITEALRHG